MTARYVRLTALSAYRADGSSAPWSSAAEIAVTRLEDALTPPAEVSLSFDHAVTKPVGEDTYVWGTAHGAEGQAIRVQAKVGDGRWATSRTDVVGDDGRFVLPLTYGMDHAGTWTFRLVLDGAEGPKAGQPFTLTRVAPLAISTNSAGSKPVHVGANVWGTVAGASAGDHVATQVQVNGVWRTSQQGAVGVGGGYMLPLTYGQSTPGSHTFRVVAMASDGRTTVSEPFTFTRTRTITVNHSMTKPVGEHTYAWGTVYGARPGDRVVTQVLVDGQWQQSRSGTVDEAHGYVLPLSYGRDRVGTHTFRIVAATATGLLVSEDFTLQRVR